MTLVVVPVRYPLSAHSTATLAEAIRISNDRGAELSILHVDLYQDTNHVSRTELKTAVEREFGDLQQARYVVRRGFLVEETILEEIAAEKADVVVIGSGQASQWKRMVRKLLSDPDIGAYLREKLDCTVITVDADGRTDE
ncbi:universal stress protein family protein [Halohasta litchfieldiae]|jgi:nucleotide-binding universal stress UspA family protein|uniref:Universal stress protein family protein n=1 Tax=Halohasta litchfieldiae TaxID=1073996 RepID=A0A1H6SGE9_9EURY|nr:universal stress protein [Halohasta litchfieldiae]ATW89901.1 universal stress protein family protein [Halohasta litchfieldiae]SEI67038.1 Universal stress protein family protein [Halohasta litchfieldiae]